MLFLSLVCLVVSWAHGLYVVVPLSGVCLVVSWAHVVFLSSVWFSCVLAHVLFSLCVCLVVSWDSVCFSSVCLVGPGSCVVLCVCV